ncbi:zinc finger, CCHC-type containing protein [Tanacetum coccineum]
MFQQHQGESLSEAWTRFKDLLQKVSYHGIGRWLQMQKIYDHVSFHIKCEINRTVAGKLRDKNVDESWKIIENLALYDHDGWNDSKDFVKPVKFILTSQNTPKMPDRILLKLEDHINFLLKGPQPVPKASSTHVPQAYVKAVSSSPHPRNLNEPPRQNFFTFRERIGPYPQPQALETTFEARIRDYMVAHTERMERFENTIFKQREEINNIMTKMFGLLKELTVNRTPEKGLIREETRHPVTKNVNSISLVRTGEEKSTKDEAMFDDISGKPDKSKAVVSPKEVDKENEAENTTGDKLVKRAEEKLKKIDEEKSGDTPNSQSIGYYLKHKINEKLVEGLIENQRFNDSLLATRVGKMKQNTYNLLPRGPVYEAILKKKITRKEDFGGNFEIPCNVGGLKHLNALVDQGSDVNAMPLSIYKRLTDERLAETDIRLSLASHSYIYPLGIVEDVLVDVAGYLYLVTS